MAASRASFLGAALRAARKVSGLTQADLADRAGVARATIVQIEGGRGRLPTLTACAAALGQTITVEGGAVDGVSVGTALADKRRQMGLTPLQASALAKIRIQSVADIEVGGDKVLVATAERLAEALGCRLTLAPAANPYASQSATEES